MGEETVMAKVTIEEQAEIDLTSDYCLEQAARLLHSWRGGNAWMLETAREWRKLGLAINFVNRHPDKNWTRSGLG